MNLIGCSPNISSGELSIFLEKHMNISLQMTGNVKGYTVKIYENRYWIIPTKETDCSSEILLRVFSLFQQKIHFTLQFKWVHWKGPAILLNARKSTGASELATIHANTHVTSAVNRNILFASSISPQLTTLTRFPYFWQD